MNKAVISALRCPITGQPLTFHDGEQPYLQTSDGSYRYPVQGGIAMLLPEDAQKTEPTLPNAES
ncbi:hypothetical protein KRX19_07280 [Cardiobacteriaceae bacterium TAE3-ERU3]|nr:hypothetical protein [Cardiobacteriaceae bacterium TAE3-ERU3]